MYTTHTVQNRLACSHVWHLCICSITVLRMVPWCRRNQCQVCAARRWQLISNWCLLQTACKQQTPTCKQSPPWQHTIKPHFSYNGIKAVVPQWQMFERQWWLHGGLVCTISYTSANQLPCTYQPEWSSWCQSVVTLVQGIPLSFGGVI